MTDGCHYLLIMTSWNKDLRVWKALKMHGGHWQGSTRNILMRGQGVV